MLNIYLLKFVKNVDYSFYAHNIFTKIVCIVYNFLNSVLVNLSDFLRQIGLPPNQ